MFGDLYDLTVRMSIFVGRIASAVTYTMLKRMVCEARAKRARANHERRLTVVMYVMYHIITCQLCTSAQC